MDLKDKKIGFAMTGSFCTFKKVIEELKLLCETGAEIFPIMSIPSSSFDTRFGSADGFMTEIRNITKKEIITTIPGAEPIGPKNYLDALVISPCTGNTLAKLACGITDTPVTMAAKATLRNKKPVIIAVSTNDGLSASAKNIGLLLNTKNIYFVPFSQDDCINKPTSLVADMTKITQTVKDALSGTQLQPVIF
ncbi:MAG: dipicolinate synthase subunit B [Ruminococcaceae bacterium]|nr:dipicolinate synthase subunit B [Oscillospiraceae bacterium]